MLLLSLFAVVIHTANITLKKCDEQFLDTFFSSYNYIEDAALLGIDIADKGMDTYILFNEEDSDNYIVSKLNQKGEILWNFQTECFCGMKILGIHAAQHSDRVMVYGIEGGCVLEGFVLILDSTDGSMLERHDFTNFIQAIKPEQDSNDNVYIPVVDLDGSIVIFRLEINTLTGSTEYALVKEVKFEVNCNF